MNIASTQLSGKRALVTGASSGLGAHFAALLAAHGAEVVIAARRMNSLKQVAEEVGAYGRITPVQLDMTQASGFDEVLEAAGPIDILVNNAGIARSQSALTQTEADWDEVIDTNLKGMFFLAQRVARGMRERGGGSIINIASILGLRQAGNVLPYSVSKAGVIQMTKSLALEWARYGIRVNAIAPGYFDTEINRDFWSSPQGEALVKRIPQRRLGKMEDLDGPLLLLASDASRYMTGSTLVVDGGHLVSSL